MQVNGKITELSPIVDSSITQLGIIFTLLPIFTFPKKETLG